MLCFVFRDKQKVQGTYKQTMYLDDLCVSMCVFVTDWELELRHHDDRFKKKKEKKKTIHIVLHKCYKRSDCQCIIKRHI